MVASRATMSEIRDRLIMVSHSLGLGFQSASAALSISEAFSGSVVVGLFMGLSSVSESMKEDAVEEPLRAGERVGKLSPAAAVDTGNDIDVDVSVLPCCGMVGLVASLGLTAAVDITVEGA
jgi:hypothetical protein